MTDIPARLADLDDPGSGRDDFGAWESPVPLTAAGELPPFPIAALPAWAGDMVAAVAEFTQTPADLSGVVFLGALAAAVGGRAEVEVEPGWREPVNIYAAPAMPPGSRKSAVFREMICPLVDAEQAMQEQAREDINERKITLEIAQQAARKAVETAAKVREAEADDAKADALAKAQWAESIQVPGWPRLVADDATPEALTSLLAGQGGRIAVLSAEGDLFDIMSGRYSKDGQVPNLGVFLKGHAGDLLLVDRKGRDPERIDKPALTIVVTIQPQVLLDIARRPVLRGRGLLARVLYSLPPDTVGYRRVSVEPVPAAIAETYHRNLKALALSLADWTDPAVLMLTPEARKLLAEYQEEIEPRLRAIGGDLAELRDWASKLAGATGRIAGLLHLAADLDKGWGNPVEADTMAAAIDLGRYFTAHARAAFARMGTDPLVDDALAVLAWIERSHPERFTRRDAHVSLSRARFPKVGDLEPALALLSDHGYIRREPGPERSGRGRPPSPGYRVHPDLCHRNHENHRIHGQAP